MATTHALAGMVLGLALAPVAPAAAPTLALAGAAGGVAPDLDALSVHRKHLHFPVYGVALAALVGVAVAATGSGWLAALGVAVGAAALHALSDALDGGRSVRPWAESVERAVYCHAQGRWWRPRRLIPFDGSPADLAVAVALGSVLVLADPTPAVRAVVFGLLAASAGYVAVRRRIPAVIDGATDRFDAAIASVGRDHRR